MIEGIVTQHGQQMTHQVFIWAVRSMLTQYCGLHTVGTATPVLPYLLYLRSTLLVHSSEDSPSSSLATVVLHLP